MAKITKEELLHIADVARLHLSEEEAEALAKDIEVILEHFASISKYEGEGMTHILKGAQPLRADDAAMPSDAEAIVSMFSRTSGRFAKVVRGLKKG